MVAAADPRHSGAGQAQGHRQTQEQHLDRQGDGDDDRGATGHRRARCDQQPVDEEVNRDYGEEPDGQFAHVVAVLMFPVAVKSAQCNEYRDACTEAHNDQPERTSAAQVW